MRIDPSEFEISDQREELPIFVHSKLDDLGLTAEAFRVYCHLARRAGRAGHAYPSYRTIGEKCFSVGLRTTKNPEGNEVRQSKPFSLSRQRLLAFRAVQELEECGLIEVKQRRKDNQSRDSNVFVLLHSNQWGRSSHDPGVDRPTIQGRSSHDPGVDRPTIQGRSSHDPKGTPLEDSPIEGSPKKVKRASAQIENSTLSAQEQNQTSTDLKNSTAKTQPNSEARSSGKDPEQTSPRSARPSPPAKMRREAPGLIANEHPYPEMVRAGLGALWIGANQSGVNRFRSFDLDLITGAIAHLRKHDLPHERGDAIHCVLNAIRSQEWGKLAGWHEAGKPPDRLRPDDAPLEEELVLPEGYVPPEVLKLAAEGRINL